MIIFRRGYLRNMIIVDEEITLYGFSGAYNLAHEHSYFQNISIPEKIS
jgi:hypothetical protein